MSEGSIVRWRLDDLQAPTLLCFGHAGAGAAAFRPWASWLRTDVNVLAVRLPGRESRLGQRPFTSIWAVVEALRAELVGLGAANVTLLGHCSGALIAFELARALQSAPDPRVAQLIVSSQVSPALYKPRMYDRTALLEEVARLGGTPVELLADPNYVDLVLPALEADYNLLAGYRFQPEPSMSAPIHVFFGDSDAEVPKHAAEAWRSIAGGVMTLRQLSADHFFSGQAWRAYADAVEAVLLGSG